MAAQLGISANTVEFHRRRIKKLNTNMDLDAMARLFSGRDFKEDYRILNGEIRRYGFNIPPLVNAYMSLSPGMRMFGTAINTEFGDVEESAIIIAVDEIFEEKRVRHINSFVAEHPEALKIPMPKK